GEPKLADIASGDPSDADPIVRNDDPLETLEASGCRISDRKRLSQRVVLVVQRTERKSRRERIERIILSGRVDQHDPRKCLVMKSSEVRAAVFGNSLGRQLFVEAMKMHARGIATENDARIAGGPNEPSLRVFVKEEPRRSGQFEVAAQIRREDVGV